MVKNTKHTIEEELNVREHDKELQRIYSEALEQPLQQETELAGVLRLMNEDAPEKGTHFRKVDFITRLHRDELAGMVIHDSLVGLGVLPTDMLVTTTQKKRLAVSLNGEGRKESVEMVRGERTSRRVGFMERLGNMFRPGDKGDNSGV